MKPFDLEAARNGEKVVTRDGREATLDPLSLTPGYWKCCFIVEGVSYAFRKDGQKSYSENPLDLFMK